MAAAIMTGLASASVSRASRAESDDRALAEALAKPTAVTPSPVTSQALAHANDALERGTRLRAAGDEAHAKAADGLAREWAETARDLGLAVAAEKMAEDRKRQAVQAQAQLQRTRALVEESVARLGRLQAELDAAVAATKKTAAVEAHDDRPGRPAKRGESRDRTRDTAGAAPNGAAP